MDTFLKLLKLPFTPHLVIPVMLSQCYYFVRADGVRFPVSKQDWDAYEVGDTYTWINPWK